MGDGGVALRSRPVGGGCKPPQAAPVKSRGGERCGKRRAVSASGASREGERERTTDDVSKCLSMTSKPGVEGEPGMEPGGCLLTAQVVSGMKVARARLRLSCGTWEPVVPMLSSTVVPAARGRVPSGGIREGLSTDAGHRGGPARG
jgi:hypothetical protein